jgi:hypothetical protein
MRRIIRAADQAQVHLLLILHTLEEWDKEFVKEMGFQETGKSRGAYTAFSRRPKGTVKRWVEAITGVLT